MNKKVVLFLIMFITLFLTGCMEHIDLPAPLETPIPLETKTPTPNSFGSEFFYGTNSSVNYSDVKDVVDEGVRAFGNNPILYRDVISQCLFQIEERKGSEKLLSRIDSTPSFYIENDSSYGNRYKEIVSKIIDTIMPRAYIGKYKPTITDDEDAATFVISFVSSDTYMGALFFTGGLYGLYITGKEEENVIKGGLIYVRDYDFLKSTNPSFVDSEIWTMIEAILSEEMSQAPIDGQDTNLDSTMRFYDSPKIDDYLRNPDLTQKDYEVVKIALKLPPGVNKAQWMKFMNQYIKGGE